jgi:hypothetical protein
MKSLSIKTFIFLSIIFITINCKKDELPSPTQSSPNDIKENVQSSTGVNFPNTVSGKSTSTLSGNNTTDNPTITPSTSVGNNQDNNTANDSLNTSTSGSNQSTFTTIGNNVSNPGNTTTTIGNNSNPNTTTGSNSSSGNNPPTITVTSSVSYALDIAPILQNRGCNGCHGYNLTSARADAGPSSAVNSILNRINRSQGSAGFMPRNGSKLPQSEIDKIQAWFDSGMNP